MRSTRFLTIALASLAVTCLAMPSSGFGLAPSNDNLVDAGTITSLPFAHTVEITEATIEPEEPIANPGEIGRTVWYSFRPTADAVAQIGPPFSAPGPGPPTLCDLRSDRFLVVYRADAAGFAGLVPVAGDQWSTATVHTLRVETGTTYYIQGGQRGALSCGQNTFSLSVSVVLPPPNDNFANAIAVASVPFSDSRNLTGATVESDEPMACGSSFDKSAWYAFMPTTSGAYGAFGASNVNVHTGPSLNNLTNVACADWPGLYFHADAGTTYYLQIYGDGTRGLSVDVVPPPQVGFIYSPDAPSILDDVSFTYWIGGYWDPTVTGYAWDFGDGTTAAGSPTSHQFAESGDYPVTLTVSARGGRTASQTQTIHVRSNDTTPPAITVPSDLTVDATIPAGASVDYTVTATDENPTNPVVTCTPPSGSTFPIGENTVTCSATDAAGNTATESFTVQVKSASEQLVDLIARVDRYNLGQLGTALHEKLVRAQGFLGANKPKRACEVLDRFLAQVKEQRGKRISVERADGLTADARRIKAVIGC